MLELVRMLGTQFDAVGDASVNLCPTGAREAVDRTLDAIYKPINNGVYRAGFAVTQEAYEEAVNELFDALGMVLLVRLRGRGAGHLTRNDNPRSAGP